MRMIRFIIEDLKKINFTKIFVITRPFLVFTAGSKQPHKSTLVRRQKKKRSGTQSVKILNTLVWL